MDTKLYDLFDDQARFLMRAPMSVIGAVMKAHRLAIQRLTAETKATGIAELHMNGRPHPFVGNRFVVQSAVGERGSLMNIPARSVEA